MANNSYAIVVLFIVIGVAITLCNGSSLSRHTESSSSVKDGTSYDVIVFGATPAGFAASLGAKAAGADKVLLIEPTGYVGGMASPGGIGLRDCNMDEVRDNSGTQHQWAMRNAAYYGLKGPVWQPDNWLGERTFLEMLKEADIELRLNTTFLEGSKGINTETDANELRRIVEIILESGDILNPRYVIDASYEGELMAATGHVSYTFGRESNDTYNESLGGVTNGSVGQFDIPINPYYANTDNLLKWVSDYPDPRTKLGEADDNVMAYSFRVCLSKNTSNMVPVKQPQGYNPDDFELQRRYLQAEVKAGKDPHKPWGYLVYKAYPSSKKDMKYDACCGMSPVGIDAVGLAVGYSNGTRAQRKEIYDKHRYYVQGLMWFWANDPAVPESIRESMKSYGLCKDEWPENDNFPPQMYVREAARIIGDKVFSQNNRVPYSDMGKCNRDSIAVGSWAFDIHEMERVAVKDKSGNPIVYNEGLTKPSTGGAVLFDIPYYVLMPKRSELINLAVPNCPSVSHVAFSAIREEPTLWQLGEAAGTAAGLSVAGGGQKPLQDIDLKKLQAALLKQGTFVRWPPHQNCTEFD